MESEKKSQAMVTLPLEEFERLVKGGNRRGIVYHFNRRTPTDVYNTDYISTSIVVDDNHNPPFIYVEETHKGIKVRTVQIPIEHLFGLYPAVSKLLHEYTQTEPLPGLSDWLAHK